MVRTDAGGAAQMRESDGWKDEDLQVGRRKIGPACGLEASPRASCTFHAHLFGIWRGPIRGVRLE